MSEIQRYEFDAKNGRVLGEPKTLLASTDLLHQFDVSRDGKRLAYRTGAPREDLVVMNLDGTGRRRLMDDVYRDRGPRWYPDGSLLLFYSNRGGTYNAWRIRPDGTDARPITSSRSTDFVDAIVSQDERRFAGTLSLATEQATALYELEQPLASLTEPLSEPTTTVNDFSPFRFSPDGRYLTGTLTESMSKGGLGVLALETKKITLIRVPDGGTILTFLKSGMDWIDDKRFITWDEKRDTAFIYDVETDATHEVTGIRGPGDIRVVEDGAALIVNRTREEADIWMLTLDTIEETPRPHP